jgi:hypothetical protein
MAKYAFTVNFNSSSSTGNWNSESDTFLLAKAFSSFKAKIVGCPFFYLLSSLFLIVLLHVVC